MFKNMLFSINEKGRCTYSKPTQQGQIHLFASTVHTNTKLNCHGLATQSNTSSMQKYVYKMFVFLMLCSARKQRGNPCGI